MATVDMAPRAHRRELPYGVGQVTVWWLLIVVIAGLVALFGAFAYSRQALEGLVVTGLRNIGTMGGATWGLYITFDVYFVGVSFAGITMAALIRLLNLEYLKPVSRMAELLTITALILAIPTILADLGQPLRGLINLPRYARPQSAFFGTFTLVIAGYLFASLVYFYLDGRRDAAICARVPSRLRWFHRLWAAGYRDTPAERDRRSRSSFWLAIAIVPLLITAHSTLGFVFGLQAGRPGWFSTLQAPGFVVMAGVSGIGLLVVIVAIMRYVLGDTRRLGTPVFRFLGLALMILSLAYAYFWAVEVLTETYAAFHHEAVIAQARFWGDFAWMFWLSVASLAIPIALLAWQAYSGRWNIPLMIVSGLLVQIAAVFKRLLIVVPSQTHGMLLPYETGSYTPSWVEISVIVGLLGFGILLFAMFIKIFPIMEVEDSTEGGTTHA
jgi:Ni/Fe-hydrogenase subunit HybB-like protein